MAAAGGGGGRGTFLYCLKPTVTWSQLVGGGGGDDGGGAAAGFGAYLRFDTEEGEHWERRWAGGEWCSTTFSSKLFCKHLNRFQLCFFFPSSSGADLWSGA